MNWIFLAIITGVSFGLYNFLIKLSSSHIDQLLGALVLQLAALVIGGLFFTVKLIQKPIEVSSSGVKLAILAGVFVGLAEVLSFYVFAKGAPASVGIPIIIGTSILVGSLLGILFLKESPTIFNYLGITLVIIGIVFLGIKK
ncbi:MAG: EamA family transporter [Candidatus Gracilibacteria bacterium]|jgi:transporter family protein